MKQPIIIIGMHRSGTTLLTKQLAQLGVFVGDKTEINKEALFFYRLNRWLLSKANATWDNPYNYQFIDEYYKTHALRILKKQLSSYRTKQYLGNKLALKYRANLFNLDVDWGWKDPINSLTLDLWLDLFPQAKILHIYRHPMDVAASLRTRELKIQRVKNEQILNSKAYKSILEKDFRTHSFRVKHLKEGVKLWEIYVEEALKFRKLEGQYHEVCYEDYLENPVRLLEQVVEFVGLEVEKPKLQKVCEQINASRKFAYRKKEELVAFYETVKNTPLIKELYG